MIERGSGGYASQGGKGGLQQSDDIPVSLVRVHYACAAVGSNETKFLLRVKKGQRILNVSLRQGVSADGGSTATWTVGDSATHNGYVLSTSCVQTAGTLTDGAGTYCTTQGKVYTTIDSINLYYTAGGGAGATAPSCDVRFTVQHEWPEV